jgi:hypothetical protein
MRLQGSMVGGVVAAKFPLVTRLAPFPDSGFVPTEMMKVLYVLSCFA